MQGEDHIRRRYASSSKHQQSFFILTKAKSCRLIRELLERGSKLCTMFIGLRHVAAKKNAARTMRVSYVVAVVYSSYVYNCMPTYSRVGTSRPPCHGVLERCCAIDTVDRVRWMPDRLVSLFRHLRGTIRDNYRSCQRYTTDCTMAAWDHLNWADFLQFTVGLLVSPHPPVGSVTTIGDRATYNPCTESCLSSNHISVTDCSSL